MAAPRIAHALFFDDARQEVGNKVSLMGMYVGDLVLSPAPPSGVPAVLPKFVICAWLLCDWGDEPERLTIRVYAPPGRTEVFKHESVRDHTSVPIASIDNPTRLAVFITVPLVPFVLADEGEVAVVIETEEGEHPAGRLRVRMLDRQPLSTGPTALPQPFEQSLPDAPV
jgi:hypothetical protein